MSYIPTASEFRDVERTVPLFELRLETCWSRPKQLSRNTSIVAQMGSPSTFLVSPSIYDAETLPVDQLNVEHKRDARSEQESNVQDACNRKCD